MITLNPSENVLFYFLLKELFMPAMANITVKKNDGTTDIVYTGVVPSAGDKSPAIFRSNSVGSAPAHRPELQLSSQWNGPRTARRIQGKYTYPVTAVGSDGKTNVVDRGIIEFSGLVPQTMSDTDINEMVSQSGNLVVSTLIRSSMKEGYAPT